MSSFVLSLQQRTLQALQRLAPTYGPAHLRTGHTAEQQAIFHLRRLGYTIVAHRWRSIFHPGDLDILAWDGPTLVVFEIKSRCTRDASPAESTLDRVKQRQLQRLTRSWLRRLPARRGDSVPVRYDLLTVYLLPTGIEFEHFRNIL